MSQLQIASSNNDSGVSSDIPSASAAVPLAWLAAACAVTALMLYALQQALRLSSVYGIEDLAGWKSAATVETARSIWCDRFPHRWHTAVVYVLADTAVFMPLYGAFVLAATRAMADHLREGSSTVGRNLRLGLPISSWLFVALLWALDALENLAGAVRLGVGLPAYVTSVIMAIVVFGVLMRVGRLRSPDLRRSALLRSAALVGAAAIVVLLSHSSDRALACAWIPSPGLKNFGLTYAHQLKPLGIGLALTPLAVGGLAWWFGFDLDLNERRQRLLATARAAWRSGVAGVIGRSRYVILMLVVFSTFTIVLDQSRDVLLALATPGASAGTAGGEFARIWNAFVRFSGAVGLGFLSYACWLWTRLAVMVERRGLALPSRLDVHPAIGRFACAWARAIAMVPLLVFGVLLARTVGDAVVATRIAKDSVALAALVTTLWTLGIIGVLTVAAGAGFIALRRRLALPADPDDRDRARVDRMYYNAVRDVRTLLRCGTIDLRRRTLAEPARRRTRRVAWISAPFLPTVMPLVVLAWMLLLRAVMAWLPDIAAQAPATFALLCLSVAWWMSVAGALSMAEQRQTVPWGLAVLFIVGALEVMGVADNHMLASASTVGVDVAQAGLHSLRVAGFSATLVLTLLSGLLWWLSTYRPIRAEAAIRWKPRALCMLGAIFATLGVLRLLDTKTQAPEQSASAARESLDDAMRRFARALPKQVPTDDPRHVYLIASEGGGSRAAFWTALALATLHDADKARFDARTVVLSGVSGGAIGEAVYLACRRKASPDEDLTPCVTDGFGKLDPLSPLIGGLLFEDVFARLLPLGMPQWAHVCPSPGCGFLSRALGFEREWARQFPQLLAPATTRPEGEPLLMLNSTWVESGNRVTFSSARPDPGQWPGAVDALLQPGMRPSLITAAHAAARFPYINPLASVTIQRIGGAGTLAAHLGDGGYHDNSGVEAASDAWRALKDKLPSGWRPQLILIRNGAVPATCPSSRSAEPTPSCLRDDSSTGPAPPGALQAPLERDRLAFYADLLGPPLTLWNVSGVGARSRQAAGQMDADLASIKDASDLAPTCVIDQTRDAALVPLGWYLSDTARAAMTSALEKSKRAPVCPPGS